MKKYLVACMIPMLLSSCGGLLVATGVATTGYVASQDRSAGRVFDDAATWSKLKTKLANDANKRFHNVHVKVNEGRVLLTGHVADRIARVNAVKLAWEVDDVVEVVNSIEISRRNRHTIKNFSRDTWITTQIKSKLLFADKVKSANYSIDTIDGVVYIMGIAETREEIERVSGVASKIPHVKNVVSHIRLKNDFLRKTRGG